MLGAVFALFPRDALRSLALDLPRHWALWYGVCAGPLLVAAMLWMARSRPALRPGLLAAAVLWNLCALTLGMFFVVWDELPRVLLGPVAAAGLWAWLLGGLYSERS